MPEFKPEIANTSSFESKKTLDKSAMEKVVDILSQRGLKLRESNDNPDEPRIMFLEREIQLGVISPYNKRFFSGGQEQVRARVGEQKEILEKEKQLRINPSDMGDFLDEATSNEAQEYQDYKEFSHRANVFYPEGILDVMCSLLENNFEFDADKTNNVYSRVLIEIGDKFSSVIARLVDKKKISLKHADILELALNQKGLGFLPRQEREISEEEIEELRKEILDNIDEIRREWLKFFYAEANNPQERGVSNILIDRPLHQGIIFEPKTDVVVSYHYDYPTQATIRDLGNKNRIVGLFIRHGLENVQAYPSLDIGKPVGFPLPKSEFDKIISEDERLKQMSESGAIKFYRQDQTGIAFKLVSLDAKERDYLERKMNYLIERYTVLRKGMTNLEAMIKIAEKYSLPLYDLKGNLLWPKQLGHEQLVEELRKKANSN